MKNEDLWKSYEVYTKTLSDTSRQLGFAAAAICWFFKTPQHSFPGHILLALGFVVVFFVADILQYLLGAIFLRTWTRFHEKKKWKETGKIEGDYLKPSWLDYPSYLMWWAKVLALLTGFIFIGLELTGR
jgi:hypothetical protein